VLHPVPIGDEVQPSIAQALATVHGGQCCVALPSVIYGSPERAERAAPRPPTVRS
jgi:hypothetical protein